MRNLTLIIFAFLASASLKGQINTDQVLNVGRNALYFEDYVLSIQYFNQVISAKPYLAQPYFYRALAKYNLDDMRGAEADVSMAIERNPFITDAYELRGVLRQNQGKTELAIDDYNKALEMLPENRQLLFNKSMALLDMKDYDGSAATFDRLMRLYPGYDTGLIGRAQLEMARKDTTAAMADVEKALSINKHLTNGYIMRAEIRMNAGKDSLKLALEDMDEAIRLNPKNPGFFINRAFIRYKLDDYFGAMSDYDYAIELEPENFVAHFNRAMLCAEVKEYDKALLDFNEVIRLRPDEYRTLYNRAIVYRDRREYKQAMADVNKVIEAFPTLAAAYFLRSDIKHSLGDKTAKKDLDHSIELAKERINVKGAEGASDTSDLFGTPGVSDGIASTDSIEHSESQEVVASRFSALLTVNTNLSNQQEFNNKNIRGRVQDRNLAIEIEPLFFLTYFISPTQLKPSSDYIREIDDINRRRVLRFLLQAANHEATLTDQEDIKKHFESIQYYNSYISTHPPRAIDYFGRAMDQMTVHNYEAAEGDLTKAIELTPDFALGYFMRAIARYRMLHTPVDQTNQTPAGINSNDKQKMALRSILADIDEAIKLSPQMAAAYYNKGTLLIEAGDYTSGINALNHAIELKPDFGEAYYNRGYAYLNLGNKTAGMADLSKSGELGIVPSYNLLKRMNR